MRPLLRCALLAASLAACGAPTDPLGNRALVLVDERLSARPAVEVPATVHVGTPFDVVVNSLGSACAPPADVEVRVSGLVATVTPFESPYDGPCIDMLAPRTDTITLRFNRSGAAVVRVRVRSGEMGEETVLERPVTVTGS